MFDVVVGYDTYLQTEEVFEQHRPSWPATNCVDIAGWPVVTDGAVQTLALPDWADTLMRPTGAPPIGRNFDVLGFGAGGDADGGVGADGGSDQAARRGADRGRSQPTGSQPRAVSI